MYAGQNIQRFQVLLFSLINLYVHKGNDHKENKLIFSEMKMRYSLFGDSENRENNS
jgi:hypothetical protein